MVIAIVLILICLILAILILPEEQLINVFKNIVKLIKGIFNKIYIFFNETERIRINMSNDYVLQNDIISAMKGFTSNQIQFHSAMVMDVPTLQISIIPNRILTDTDINLISSILYSIFIRDTRNYGIKTVSVESRLTNTGLQILIYYAEFEVDSKNYDILHRKFQRMKMPRKQQPLKDSKLEQDIKDYEDKKNKNNKNDGEDDI